ncbi:serpin H1-like [Arapaima gigas]
MCWHVPPHLRRDEPRSALRGGRGPGADRFLRPRGDPQVVSEVSSFRCVKGALLSGTMWVTTVFLSLLVVAVSSENKQLSSYTFYIAEKSAIFAFKLYENLAKEKDLENILFSPLMVSASLGLVALGGKSSTSYQVKTMLNANKFTDEYFHFALEELLLEVTNSTARNVTWKLGNGLYCPSSVNVTDDFLEASKKHYNFQNFKMNFNDKESALNSISEWVNKSTGGKLPGISVDLEKTDGAVIVNAIYFKLHWDERFHHKMVDRRSFLVDHSLTIFITMMHSTGVYGFHEDLKNKLYVLCMPLALKKSFMVFIMPYHVEPLDRLEKLLSYKQLENWLSRLDERLVTVSLPKMVLDVTHDLQKNLAAVGLTDAVDKAKADLSSITGKKDLYLSHIFHASALEWSTEGNPFDTSIFGTEKFHGPTLFYADHPFIFLVLDGKTRAIQFIGRLIRPKGQKMREEL